MTANKETNLKAATRRGLFWSMLGNLANQGMRFAFGIILARLLTPEAYGIVGMVMVFVAVISVFIDCGFAQALICKKDREDIDYSTEFWFNVGVGIVGYGVLFLIAPFVALFYAIPELCAILRVVGLGVIVNSLAVVPTAIFQIRLDFKTPATISVIAHLVSGAIGIAIAYSGGGVWALVVQQIVSGALTVVVLWCLAHWRPLFRFSKSSFQYLWSYGSRILGASIIQQVYDNLYPLIIGRFFSAASLGLYSRAQGFATLPSTNISGVLNNVSFPILSKINGDGQRLKDVYTKMIQSTAFLVFPMMLGLAAVSDPLVRILLNEQWYGCVGLLQVLCIALIWHPLSSLQLNVIKAVGRSDIILTLEFIKRSLGIISIVISLPFGVFGLCVGFAILYVVCFSMNTYFVGRVLNTSALTQLSNLIPVLLNAVLMASIVSLLVNLVVGDWCRLLLGIVVGVAYYAMSAKLLFQGLLQDTISIVRR